MHEVARRSASASPNPTGGRVPLSRVEELGGDSATPGETFSLRTTGLQLRRERLAAGEATPAVAPLGVVVDDERPVAPGQWSRSTFMVALRAELAAVCDRELAAAGRTSRGCPYLSYWLAYYERRPAGEIERAIHLYTGVRGRDPAALVAAVVSRVEVAVRRWATTGEVAQIPSAPGLPSALAEPPEQSPSAPILQRQTCGARESSSPAATSPSVVQAQLGRGQSLDLATRTRMERGLGRSFTAVRVHTDVAAARLARALRARAFTVGPNVAFERDQYQPGTPHGDLLLAHELAHVIQQSSLAVRAGQLGRNERELGPSEREAEEREADRLAVRAITSVDGPDTSVLRAPAPPARSQAREGLRLQRCTQATRVRAEAFDAPTVTPEHEALMERLEGRHHLFIAAVNFAKASHLMVRISTVSGIDPFAEGYIPDLLRALRAVEVNLGIELGPVMPDEQTFERIHDRALDALNAEAREEGFRDLRDFLEQAQSFEAFFELYAQQTAFDMLRRNRERVLAEQTRYEGAGAGGDVTALQAALRDNAKLAMANDLQRQATRGMGAGEYAPSGAEVLEARENQRRAKQLEEEARRELATGPGQFLILMDPNLDLVALRATNLSQVRQRLQSTVQDRLADIQKAWDQIREDKDLVWHMPPVIAEARYRLGIVEGTIYDAIIRDRRERETFNRDYNKYVRMAATAGLGFAAMGGSLFALVGSFAASAYEAARHYEQYRIEKASAGTAFDRAEAIGAEDPSLFWLAVDIGFVFVDGAAAIKAFRNLRGAARAVVEAQTAQEASEQAARLRRLAAAEAAGVEGVNPERFAEQVAERAQASRATRRYAAAGEEVLAARRAISGLDTHAAAGLSRVPAATRTRLIALFRNEPAVLQRLGYLSELSDDAIKGIETLRAGLPDEAFRAIIGDYARMRTVEASSLLRAIGAAGIETADVRRIAAGMTRVRTARGFTRKFGPAISEAIAERIGGGPDGYRRLLEVTEGLHPSQSGSIFERWARVHVYRQGLGTRFYATTDELARRFPGPGRFRGTKITTDDTAVLAGDSIIVDYKHFREAGRFHGAQLDQLENYAEMIARRVTGPNGQPFRRVHYIFSTREAAEANAATIRATLRGNVRVFFVDAAGTLQTLP